MQEERLNEELEEESEVENETTENTEAEEETTQSVELLQYRSKEEIVKEIDDFVIDDSLSLEEKINKCRFEEELTPIVKDINFEENILIETFSGNEERLKYWTNLQKLVNEKLNDKKSSSLLPKKKDYIKTKIDEDKRKVDAENRKRKEAAKPKPKESSKPKEAPKPTKYKYPFKLHFAGHNIETDHIFENEKEYAPEEITKKMLEHQYYEFAGSVSYTYMEKENVLIPIFQQYKKG